MTIRHISIPDDLMLLKSSDDLQSVSMTQLARKGTAILRQLTESNQAVAVKIQGQGAMVTLSQRQYDEMIELLQQLRQESEDDGFLEALAEQFDVLSARMSDAESAGKALFTEAEYLNRHYRPGDTEAT